MQNESAQKYLLPPAWLSALFIMSGAVTIVSIYAGWLVPVLLTKWVPPVLLALWAGKSAEGSVRTAVVAGLLFSALGDMVLEGARNLPDSSFPWFILGLSCFLIAHICYITMFSLLPARRRWWPLLAMAAFGISFSTLLVPRIGPLAGPVIAYTAVISIMVWRATCAIAPPHAPLWLRTSAAVGAVLFAFSDSTIAVNKFFEPFYLANLVILLTYWTAQFGIAASAVNYPRLVGHGIVAQ